MEETLKVRSVISKRDLIGRSREVMLEMISNGTIDKDSKMTEEILESVAFWSLRNEHDINPGMIQSSNFTEYCPSSYLVEIVYTKEPELITGIVHEAIQISIPNNDLSNISEILIDAVNTPCKCCLKKMEEFKKSGFPENSNFNEITTKLNDLAERPITNQEIIDKMDINLEKTKIISNRLDLYLKCLIKTDRQITNMICHEFNYNDLLAVVKEYKYNSSNCCDTQPLDLCVDNPLTLASICKQLEIALEQHNIVFVSKNYYLEYYVKNENLCILLYV